MAIGKKISLVGCGNIGSTLAAFLMRDGAFETLVLLDKFMERTQGRAMDMMQAMGMEDRDSHVVTTDDYGEMSGSEVVVVTAGSPRIPGMSRNDLLKINIPVIAELGTAIKNHCPDALVIVVTNPMDNMAWVMYKASGLSAKKVLGMGGILDSARFRFYIKEGLAKHGVHCAYSDVEAMVLGSHNNTMVPLVSTAMVMGQALEDFVESCSLPRDIVSSIVENTVGGGGAIVKLLGNGSAYVAPAMGVLKMIESFLRDGDHAVPCSVYMEDEDIYAGLPVVIGRSGLKEVCSVNWSQDEKRKFDLSLESNRESVRECEKILNELT